MVFFMITSHMPSSLRHDRSKLAAPCNVHSSKSFGAAPQTVVQNCELIQGHGEAARPLCALIEIIHE